MFARSFRRRSRATGEGRAGGLWRAGKSSDIGPEDRIGEIVKGLLEAVRNSGLPVVDDEAEDVFPDELLGEEWENHQTPLGVLGLAVDLALLTNSLLDKVQNWNRVLPDVL